MEDKKDISLQDKNNEAQKSFDLTLSLKDKGFGFVYRKIERILTAVYLVTNLISDTEPLKREIRENALMTLKSVSFLKDNFSSQRADIISEIKTLVMENISFITTAVFAQMISQMNADILKKEYLILFDALDSNSVFALEKNFFDTDNVEKDIKDTSDVGIKTDNRPAQLSERKIFIKDRGKQISQLSAETKSSHKGQNSNQNTRDGSKRIIIRKNSRVNVIISLLRKKEYVMIKDVSDVIKDCSEKTLQRELLSLVKKGVLRKEGERRWSKYSLLRG